MSGNVDDKVKQKFFFPLIQFIYAVTSSNFKFVTKVMLFGTKRSIKTSILCFENKKID